MNLVTHEDMMDIPVRLGGMMGEGKCFAMQNPLNGRIEIVADTIETFEKAQSSGAIWRAVKELAEKIQAENDELYSSPLGLAIDEAETELKAIRSRE